MKKIITAVAAMAMAASAFAVDISAQAKTTLDLFNLESKTEFDADGKAKEKPEEFKTLPSILKNEGMNRDDTKLVMNLNGDKAGATFRLRPSNDKVAEKEEWGNKVNYVVNIFDDYNMWIKPVDMVKIMFNTGTPGPNQEHFTWWKYHVDKVSTDLNVDVTPMAGLTITAGMDTGSYWIHKDSYKVKATDTDKLCLSATALKAAYSADFGTVYGYYGFAPKTVKEGLITKADGSIIAAGYNGKIGPVSLFADASASLSKYETAIMADLDVAFAQDAFSCEVYGLFKTTDYKEIKDVDGVKSRVGDDVKRVNNLSLLAKVEYNFGPATAYVNFTDDDLLAKEKVGEKEYAAFAANVKGGARFNVGSAALDAAVSLDLASKKTEKSTKVSVPVSVTLSL